MIHANTDPTYTMMEQRIRDSYAGRVDFADGEADGDIAEAIYWFSTKYHNGLSNLYAAIKQTGWEPSRLAYGPTGYQSDMFYESLVDWYGCESYE